MRRRDRAGPDRAASISAPAIPRAAPCCTARGCSPSRPAITRPKSIRASAKARPARCCAAFFRERRSLMASACRASRLATRARPCRPLPPLAPFPGSTSSSSCCWWRSNGVFAMSELAIVSSRKPRLKAMARAGRRGAQTALDLASDPGRFLSTVQIGITLIGILAGAYSGASLGGPVGQRHRAARRRPGHGRDARLRPRHRPHHLCLAGDRRAGAQAIRAALARADRGRRGAADAAGCRGRPRPSSGCSTGPARSIFRLLRPEPRIGRPGHRRGAPPGRRRGGDRRRARGERAGDHLRAWSGSPTGRPAR